MSDAEVKPTPSNRKFYLLVAAFLLAAVLMGVFSALRSGPTELERYKAELRAIGEKLTFDELMPGVLKTNRLPGRATDLERIVKVLRAKNRRVEDLETMHHLGDGRAEAVWARTNMLTTAGKNSPGSAQEWEQLEEDMAAVSVELDEALTLVAVPDAHAGLNYDILASAYQHRGNKSYLARWFAALHAARIREGRHADAQLVLEGLMQLFQWHREELTVEDQLNRIGVGTLALNLTWSTLQSEVLTDAQVGGLLTRWQDLELASRFLRALEVERAMGQRAFALGRERGVSALFGTSEKFLDPLWRMTANADELFFLRQSQTILELARDAERAKSYAQVKARLVAKDAELEALLYTWQRLGFMVTGVTRLSYAGNDRTQQRFHRYESHRSMTVAAITLELYRRKHGRHPESLGRLVPEFLPAVPVDWMDGQSLRYRLNPDASFTLWSVGDDCKDDGGDASGPPISMRRNNIWEGRDAVWPKLSTPPSRTLSPP